MKKLLLFAFAITTILCFASCGTNNSSQENDLPTDNLKQAIDSASSINSISYTTNYEQILKSDTDTTTTISIVENKRMKEPFVMWSKTVLQTNGQTNNTIEFYQKASENGLESSVRGADTEWNIGSPSVDQTQVQKYIDHTNNYIEAFCYLLNANLDSFKMDKNQDGLIKYNGTISQSSIVETYKRFDRDFYIYQGLIQSDNKISDSEILKEITSGKINEIMVGIPSLAFADKPIPITVWVNEKDNTIAKVEIDKTNVIQAIFDKFPLKDKVRKVEKALLTYKVIGINTFDEIPMPE